MRSTSDQGAIQFKKLSQTVPGEIFRINVKGRSALAIHIQNFEHHGWLVGLFNTPGVDKPTISIHKHDCSIVSFGNDCVIDVKLGDEPLENHNNSIEMASYELLLNEQSAALRFYRDDKLSASDAFDYDLGTGEEVREYYGVKVANWSIWANEDKRDRPNNHCYHRGINRPAHHIPFFCS